jgi:hypothetical protein
MKLNTNYLHSRQTSLDTTISSSSIYESDNNSYSDSEVDDRPAQKKRKIDNPQARTMREDLLAVDDPILEGSDCQDPYGGQDPYNETMKLLTTAGDEPIDGGLKEDSDVIGAPQSHENDKSHSPRIIPAPAAPAATAPQELVAAIDGQSATLAATALMKPVLDDPEIPQQVGEVANDKQEWEIRGIIDKEDIDGVPHYWVQWSPTLVPEYEMGKARALVARFEARLRATQAEGWERASQAASIKGRQAGSCRSSRNKPDAGEETAW